MRIGLIFDSIRNLRNPEEEEASVFLPVVTLSLIFNAKDEAAAALSMSLEPLGGM